MRRLEERYGVTRTTLYRWRQLHGHNTRFTGRRKSLAPSEWRQLDRYVVFLSEEPWGFSWNKEDYEQRFLDSEEYDEQGNPLDYFQKVDRWMLTNHKQSFDQYIEEQESKWQIFGKSARN